MGQNAPSWLDRLGTRVPRPATLVLLPVQMPLKTTMFGPNSQARGGDAG